MTPESKKTKDIAPTHRIITGDARDMRMLSDGSACLAVASPPMWEPGRRGSAADIGSANTIDRYMSGLLLVWKETYRVLLPGMRLCAHIPGSAMNVFGQISGKKLSVYEGLEETLEAAGFEREALIVWNRESKKTAVAVKEALKPRSIEISPVADFILVMKKPGEAAEAPEAAQKKSRLSKAEATRLAASLWTFPMPDGEEPDAFSPELARRLIKLYSFAGETVIDPFLGTGATSVAARDLYRLSIGFELNPERAAAAAEKMSGGKAMKGLSIEEQPRGDFRRMERKIFEAKKRLTQPAKGGAAPQQAAAPEKQQPVAPPPPPPPPPAEVKELLSITQALNINHLRMSNGRDIKLLGVETPTEFFSRNPGLYRRAFDYIRREAGAGLLEVKKVKGGNDNAHVYAYMKDGETLNGALIKAGLALSDKNTEHELRKKFDLFEKQARDNDMGIWAMKKTDTPR